MPEQPTGDFKQFAKILKGLVEEIRSRTPDWKQSELAASLQIEPPRLSEYLNGERRIPWEVIVALCRKLGVSPEAGLQVTRDWVENTYGRVWARDKSPRLSEDERMYPMLRAFAQIDIERSKAERTLEKVAARSKAVFDVMDNQSFLIFVSSTVLPIEFRLTAHRDIAEAAAKAICEGARFAYFFPTADSIEHLRDDWGHTGIDSSQSFENGFAAFRELVVLKSHNHPKPIGPIDGRLGIFRVQECPLWAAGFSFGMFGQVIETGKGAEGIRTRMTLRLPGDTFGGIIPYPVEPSFHSNMLEFARRTLNTQLTQGKCPHYEQCARQFLNVIRLRDPIIE